MKTPLQQLITLEKKARDFGFNWPDTACIFDQIRSECDEISDAIAQQESHERIQEEISDLLHAVISLCVFAGFSVDDTIMTINKKFGKRLDALQQLAREQGFETLHGQSFDFMLTLWKQIK